MLHFQMMFFEDGYEHFLQSLPLPQVESVPQHEQSFYLQQ